MADDCVFFVRRAYIGLSPMHKSPLYVRAVFVRAEFVGRNVTRSSKWRFGLTRYFIAPVGRSFLPLAPVDLKRANLSRRSDDGVGTSRVVVVGRARKSTTDRRTGSNERISASCWPAASENPRPCPPFLSRKCRYTFHQLRTIIER